MNFETNRLIIGKSIIHFDELDSTNAMSKKMLNDKLVGNGSVIVADYQTNGRGQFGNKWQSIRNENLTFSIVLNPSFLKVQQQFLLSQTISIAIANYLSLYFLKENINIKWPNDILVNNKKICGILIENTISGNTLTDSVVGIGININQVDFNHLNEKVASMKSLLHKSFQLKNELELLLNYLDKYYQKLMQGKYQLIEDLYLKYLFNLNIAAKYKKEDRFFSGVIMGVNTSGQLKMLIDGEVKLFNNKEIETIYD